MITFAHATPREATEVRAIMADPAHRHAPSSSGGGGGYAIRLYELTRALDRACPVERDRMLYAGLRRAARVGDALAMVVLCDMGSAPDAFKDAPSPLMIACKQGYALCVDLLIALGAEVNRKHRSLTALHYACMGTHIDCVDRLLASDASTATYPRHCMSALALACGRGFESGVRALLHARARIDDQALCWTVMRGDIDVLGELTAHGADVNARGTTGATPLTKLCLMGRFVSWNVLACAQLLIDARADVDARALNGDGALTGAIRASGASTKLVALLLRAGARPAPAHDFVDGAPTVRLAQRALGGWTPNNHQLFSASDRARARFLLFVGKQLCQRHGYELSHAWMDCVMALCIVRHPLSL